jgi:hypothetical protein
VPKESGPFILTSDEDGHHYVIPASRQMEWGKWCSSPNYGDEDVPDWAERVGGAPSLVEFQEYTIK